MSKQKRADGLFATGKINELQNSQCRLDDIYVDVPFSFFIF